MKRMIDLLRQYLGSRPESAVSWQLLAWAEYMLERYGEAIADINRALKLLEEPRFKLVRACILAERGIRDHKKAELRIAETLFREGLSHLGDESAMAHYNLANVLSALGEFPEAIQQYKLALKRRRTCPRYGRTSEARIAVTETRSRRCPVSIRRSSSILSCPKRFRPRQSSSSRTGPNRRSCPSAGGGLPIATCYRYAVA